MNTNARFLTIIGDLIGSRSLGNRRDIQTQMRKALEGINARYASILVSKCTLTLGDEFQCIAFPDRRIFEMLDALEAQMDWPFRTGIGYGEILTEVNPELSIGADGPAFWNAREAIDTVHDKNWNGKNRTRICGLGTDRDALVNALLVTTDALKSQWTQLQRETFARLIASGIYRSEFDQKSFAETIGITPSALTRRLNAGNIKIYLHGRIVAGKTMEAWHAASE